MEVGEEEPAAQVQDRWACVVEQLLDAGKSVDLVGAVALFGADALEHRAGDTVVRDGAGGVCADPGVLGDRVGGGGGRVDPEQGVGTRGGGDDRVAVALINNNGVDVVAYR